ncbi:hypothetical protein CEUSTIGMA_g1430.t1 [Chlamydomonas eustigma]|uniref:Uncharacterized protein n=1 Tax=Chlamydomonas eustigma TaxID=1157962 RepID=A0A250WTV7_9CHLO|nr:hypothetical protein CEUSTIGMA_g1430.t1 [Chlamydomonas eustigma]|eukprot:GAX73980.1 hypothetical protein CEUSTIGMA_g1430.t1 [Chlamydomonas eustigma]
MGLSRLQNLLNLLENGSSEATRKAASRQIVDVARSHPEQLLSIIRKVTSCLYHKTWETRVAAGETIGLLASAFPHHSAQDLIALHSEQSGAELSGSISSGNASFKEFNLKQILESGSALLASGGQEYDMLDDPNLTRQQKIEKQRKQLKRRLGLDKGLEELLDTNEFLIDEDLDISGSFSDPRLGTPGSAGAPIKQQASDLLQGMEGLSARERNRLKRKAKALGRQDSGISEAPPGAAVQWTGSKSSNHEASGGKGSSTGAAATGRVAEETAADCEQDELEWQSVLEQGVWPFQRLCDQLCVDVLDVRWEVRHGAAVALREVLRSHAGAAGVQAEPQDHTSGWCTAGGTGKRRLALMSLQQLQAAVDANANWLEDCLVLLLCVLALDRFGDYGSDQVTAPVRETAAQALGMALGPLSPTSVQSVMGLLQQLMAQPLWDVRYGGYLGLKYTLAARLDLSMTLLKEALPSLHSGLQDSDDDVRATSADALVPLAPTLFRLGPLSVSAVKSRLWQLLTQLEELSPATSSVMQLLAHLYSPEAAKASMASTALGAVRQGQEGQEEEEEEEEEDCLNSASEYPADELVVLVPRLWLFLRHTLISVRLSTVQCLESLLISLQRDPFGASWLQPLMPALWLLMYQNLLIEAEPRILEASARVWGLMLSCAQASDVVAAASRDLIRAFIALASTPAGKTLDVSLMVKPRRDAATDGVTLAPFAEEIQDEGISGIKPSNLASEPKSRLGKKAKVANGGSQVPAVSPNSFRMDVVVGSSGEGSASRLRMFTSKALGQLLDKILYATQVSESEAMQEVLATLSSFSASTRSYAALVIWQWAGIAAPKGTCFTAAASESSALGGSHAVVDALQAVLSYPGGASCPHAPASEEPYEETLPFVSQMRRELASVQATCQAAGVVLPVLPSSSSDAVVQFVSSLSPAAVAACSSTAVQRLLTASTSLQVFEQYLHAGAMASCAAASVRAGPLPQKLNQIIQPLMTSLRKEPESEMQNVSAISLSELMKICSTRTPCPNDKLIRNICTMATSDTAQVLQATSYSSDPIVVERQLSHKAAGSRVGYPAGLSTESSISAAVTTTESASVEDHAATAMRIARLGAESALKAVALKFGSQLWAELPGLWSLITTPIMSAAVHLSPSLAASASTLNSAGSTEAVPVQTADPQAVINALYVLRVVGAHVSSELLNSVVELLPFLCACSRHPHAAVRSSAAACLSSLASAWLSEVMPPLLRLLLPQLSHEEDNTRMGAVETVAMLVSSLGFQIVAYVVLLVVPLLKRMSDTSEGVRKQATLCFGALVALLPLAQGLPSPPGLDSEQLEEVARDSNFLLQLLDSKQADDFRLPEVLQLPVALRPYQQEGVNWLAFLKRFGLHGVLADDMGLGKTLQASCIMGAAVIEQMSMYQAGSIYWPAPCLVVCPSTLVAHWVYEVGRYVSKDVLRPLQYHGTPGERLRLQSLLSWSLHPPSDDTASARDIKPEYNLVVTSYEALRSDVEWLTSHTWLYCVLDEGHVIKNPKAKTSQAVKRVHAAHRLLLSGTPIQNHVLELWSLFDFLMPGFLGSERDFNAKYGKAVQAARFSKRGSKELETGMLAVEALHKQVMPFVLRRTKAQVLHDLPPKIIQDIYCDMSSLQARLYEDFQQSSALSEVGDALRSQKEEEDGGSGAGVGGNVLKALMYMRRLCSHPALVLDWKVLEHRQAVKETLGCEDQKSAESAMSALSVAPKLAALRDLLAQCGVISSQGGEDSGFGSAAEEDDVGSGHRLLVFAQMKGMLDLVERDVLTPHGVSFLRLDGSLEATARFAVVQRFNSDPTIDVLLLTTSVGGLGLNLTSADTVVFLEHDWNPMKDLQAMDRAHRLGQTRTVNVYRLLMRDTLEEKVMGLQQFKLDMANAVVNQDNMSLKEMDTSQLLDLFGGSQQKGAAGGDSKEQTKKQSGLQAVLSSMGELWDESQYTNEFSMSSFMGKMGTRG